MRNNLILNNEYERILLSEARKSGFCKEIPYPDDIDLLSRDESTRIENKLLGRISKRKIQSLFQMMLLYDNITLPSYVEWDDYTSLEKTGYVKIHTYDNRAEYARLLFKDFDYSDYNDGLSIKPALLPAIRECIKCYNYIKLENDSKFASIIYDLYLWSKIDLNEYKTMIQENIIMLASNAEIFKQRVISSFAYSKNEIINYLLFLFDWLEVHVVDLLWCLDLSYKYDAIILNSDYRLEKIGINQNERPSEDCLVYKTLQVELGKTIGTLPHLNTLNDVFKVKEEHIRDIIRLRSVIDELEDVFRSNGKEQLIQRVVRDIQKASRDLSKAEHLDAISKWTTYFSIPIGITEFGMNFQPIIGLSAAALGTYSTYRSNAIKKKNSWMAVVR